MKTRDGYEIKKRHIYYWVHRTHGEEHLIIKIRCRLLEKMAMLATNGQCFSTSDAEQCLFKKPELARRYCVKAYKEKLDRVKERICSLENMDLKGQEVDD